MKKTMQVDVTDVALWLDTDITYLYKYVPNKSTVVIY